MKKSVFFRANVFIVFVFVAFLFASCSDNLNENGSGNYKTLANAVGIENKTSETNKSDDKESENYVPKITTGADVPDDAWVWGRLAPSGYVVLSFSAKTDKTYRVFWNDSADGTDEYSAKNSGADVTVKGTFGTYGAVSGYWYSESENTYWDFDTSSGYTEGGKISAEEKVSVAWDRTIWLKIGLAENSSDGCFAIAVLENDEPVSLSEERGFYKTTNAVTDIAIQESYETSGTLSANTSVVYYFTVKKDSLCYFFKQGDFELAFGNSARDFSSDYSGLVYHGDMITLVSEYTGIIFMQLSSLSDVEYSFSKVLTEYDPDNIVLTNKTFSNVSYLSSLVEGDAIRIALQGEFSGDDITTFASELKNITAEITLDMSDATASEEISNYWDLHYSSDFFAVKDKGIVFGTPNLVGSAFAGTKLVSIILPNDLYMIDRNAFQNCRYLYSLSIPSSTKILGDYSFSGCSALETITIPDGVIKIGDNAFENCTNLKSITIPDSVTNSVIYSTKDLAGNGSCLFRNCSNLTDVTLSANMTTVLQYAFAGCTSLASLTIPKNITYISTYAFKDCAALDAVVFEDPIGWYSRADYITTEVDSSLLEDPIEAANYIRLYTSKTLIKKE